jgi:Ca2+-dependent lipid-binding protein
LPKTLAPVWNETHEIKDYEYGDSLEFQVYDYDVGNANDLLGKVSLYCDDFDKEGGYEGVLQLTEIGKAKNSALRVKVVVLPPGFSSHAHLGESSSAPTSKVKLTVVSATGLRAADWSLRGGSSDPFCIFQLRGKPETKGQTKHISKSLAPEWNEEHEVPDFSKGDSVDFEVFDYDKGSAADSLGKCSLPASDFDKPGGYEGTIRLAEAGKGQNAFLKVKAEVLDLRAAASSSADDGASPPAVAPTGSDGDQDGPRAAGAAGGSTPGAPSAAPPDGAAPLPGSMSP